ncbi:MAG: hypothetical protein ACKVP0_19460 [Pirellulaceae bacterium]
MKTLFLSLASLLLIASATSAAEPAIATFSVDVTPPIGAPLCDGLVPVADAVDDPLFARGIVLFGDEKPIVLCAVDWVGIGNTGHDRWREALAKAAGTTADRVAVHCLHQHDAPGYDEAAEELLSQVGLSGKQYDVNFARRTIERVADAVTAAALKKQPITHYGIGKAEVKEVASNRRVMGPDGKVKYIRFSSCKDEKIRAEPEGTIDPLCRVVAFFNGETPVASLSYYATHPQSYYGQGNISSDFPGLARGLRDKEQPGVFHAHFNGAGGNVTAGKYNDGSPPLRMILAQRLAQGMKEAWDNAAAHKHPLSAKDIGWAQVGVVLPARDIIDEKKCLATLADKNATERERIRAARDLSFERRCDGGHQTILGCLKLGTGRVLHLPGEIFIEYQLAAQKLYPAGELCTAGYGDYGAGYIGTKISYGEGGYETTFVSRTAPEVEEVLLKGMKEVLGK